MDPLSEILSGFKLQSCRCNGFDHGGEWSFQVPAFNGTRCLAIISGQCWLDVESCPPAVRLQAGDCFLLPHGAPYTLASSLDVPALAAEVLFATPIVGGMITWNGGGNCFLIATRFDFSGPQAQSLLQGLPTVVHVRSETARASLRSYMEQMLQELDEPRLGGALIVQALASSLLAQALRLQLEGKLDFRVGWLRAMSDAQLKVAMTSMHQAPGRSWTLQELAHLTGMSRSAFARRFTAIVGVPAMEYLMRWRMLLAGDRLLTTENPVYQIAFSLGYDSEASFRTAFRKVMGCSPKQYRGGQIALGSTADATSMRVRGHLSSPPAPSAVDQ